MTVPIGTSRTTGSLKVAHPLETDKQHHLALLLGQGREPLEKIAKLQPPRLGRGRRERRQHVVDRHMIVAFVPLPGRIDEDVVHGREQVGAQIAYGPPGPHVRQDAGHRLLNKIVRLMRVANQHQRVAAQRRDMRGDLLGQGIGSLLHARGLHHSAVVIAVRFQSRFSP